MQVVAILYGYFLSFLYPHKLPTHGFLFGFSVSAWIVFWFHLIFHAILGIVLVVGVWQLREAARRWMIVYTFVFWTLESILFSISPTYIAAILLQVERAGGPTPATWPSVLLHHELEVAGGLLIIYFLITRKSAFAKPTTPT